MNNDTKKLIKIFVILLAVVCIFGGLVFYNSQKISNAISEPFATIADKMTSEKDKALSLSQADGYDNIQDWMNDLLKLKADYTGYADAAVDSYGYLLSEEEIALLYEYEDKIMAAESISQIQEQVDLFNAIIEEKAASVQYSSNYNYGSVYYESDNEEGNLSAKEWIAWRESGGDYNARNGQYIGRYQLSSDKLDGDYSPEHQEEVADEYVANRYGSWEAAKEFWETHGWY